MSELSPQTLQEMLAVEEANDYCADQAAAELFAQYYLGKYSENVRQGHTITQVEAIFLEWQERLSANASPTNTEPNP